MADFDRIEAAREHRVEGGLEYEEWRERIHAPEEDEETMRRFNRLRDEYRGGKPWLDEPREENEE